MKRVVVMGGLFELTDARFIAYLQAIVDGESPDVVRYGRYLGEVNNATDWSPDDASAELNKLNKLKCSRHST